MAQLDNAADSDSEERGFKSLRAGQKKKAPTLVVGAILLDRRDSKPERARSVKQNSLGNCFVAEWCADGYRKA